MLDVRLFKHRSFSISSIILILALFGYVWRNVFYEPINAVNRRFHSFAGSICYNSYNAAVAFLDQSYLLSFVKLGLRLTITTGLSLVTIAFLFMASWSSDVTYLQLLFVGGLMMLGISISADATNILMASVPRNGSGMGSAMNDVTRQLEVP